MAYFCLSSVQWSGHTRIILVCIHFKYLWIYVHCKKKEKKSDPHDCSLESFYSWMSPHPFYHSPGWWDAHTHTHTHTHVYLPPPYCLRWQSQWLQRRMDHTGRSAQRRAIGGNTGSGMTPSSLAAGYDESAACGSGWMYSVCVFVGLWWWL